LHSWTAKAEASPQCRANAGTTRIALLVNPADAATAETTVRDVEAAARAIGLQIQVVRASTSREIDAAFATLVRERPDALFIAPQPFFTSGVSN
jgi:putative tryptophan/tyrosine transport system substrate-binding protein